MSLGTVLIILIVIAGANGFMALLGWRPPDDLPVLISLILIAVVLVLLDRLSAGG